MGGRRTNWKNDLFVKLMVSLTAGFIIASYNAISDYIFDSAEFKGKMLEFKKTTEQQITQMVEKDMSTSAEQLRRTENVNYSGLLKSGDLKTINKICEVCNE